MKLSLTSRQYLKGWPYSVGGWALPLCLCVDDSAIEIAWIYDTTLINRVPEILNWPCFVYIEWDWFAALAPHARIAVIRARKRACIAEKKQRRFEPERVAGSVFSPLRHYTEIGEKNDELR